ncbi:hypothetical protein C8J57DRAFT_1226792 [Mycena rebaudengoi]|nr:hypothetical protein C8J57DRAFT_1226792 [Mycena rebaudengoi]
MPLANHHSSQHGHGLDNEVYPEEGNDYVIRQCTRDPGHSFVVTAYTSENVRINSWDSSSGQRWYCVSKGTDDKLFGFACGSFVNEPTRYLGYTAPNDVLKWSATVHNKWEHIVLEKHESENKCKLLMWKDDSKAPAIIFTDPDDNNCEHMQMKKDAGYVDWFKFYKCTSYYRPSYFGDDELGLENTSAAIKYVPRRSPHRHCGDVQYVTPSVRSARPSPETDSTPRFRCSHSKYFGGKPYPKTTSSMRVFVHRHGPRTSTSPVGPSGPSVAVSIAFPCPVRSPSDVPALAWPASHGFGLALPGFGLALPGFGLALPGFGLALPGFGLALPGFGLHKSQAGPNSLALAWPGLALA